MSILARAFELTRAGQDYLVAVGTGAAAPAMAFTRVELGDGDGAPYSEAAALAGPRLSLPVTGLTVEGNGLATVEFTGDNAGLAAPIAVTEIGLWAEIDGAEVLYAVSTPDPATGPGFLPAEVAGFVFEQVVQVQVVIATADPVVVNFDGSVLVASAEALDALRTVISVQRMHDTLATARALLDLAEAHRRHHDAYPEA